MTKTRTWAESFQTLREATDEAATARGHDLLWLTPHDHNGKPACFANCRKCNADAQVLTNPAPNETTISGAAVAIRCPGRPC